MAKRIILLNKLDNTIGPVKIALWADVPVNRQAAFASPGLKSVWAGASQAENDAIAAGQVTELVTWVLPTFNATIQDLSQLAQDKWQQFQDQITNNTIMFKPGTYFDGTWHPS